MTADDLRRIEHAHKRGPEALGYGTSLWTAWRVADLIERECGVTFSTHRGFNLGLLMRQLTGVGHVTEPPLGRAVALFGPLIGLLDRVWWRLPHFLGIRASRSTEFVV